MTTLILCATALMAQAEHQHVVDPRASIQRDTNTVFEAIPFETREEWETYAADLRRKILISAGLFPMPERTPLNPRISGRIQHDDYSVEKVYFEAYPGFFVTGNLYRPVGDGPFPATACPHGHWGHGRLEDTDTGSVAARCITFARMGIVAFSYDMVGYNDSLQLTRNWSHSGGNVSEAVRAEQALWGLHPGAMQLWAGIRTLDFLESLPDVDPERLACTGASGGGTQTFLLTAVDPRVKVAAPVNMISSTMQGGCPCENAPLIRFGASNMEIGALAAPRPMLMVSATGDWTKLTPTVEHPAIRNIYKLYGAEDKVRSHQVDAGHNYNQESREQVYRFFGEFLLGEAEKYRDFTEPPYALEALEALRVFPNDKLPEGSLTEEQIFEQFKQSRRERLASIFKKTRVGTGLGDEWRDALGDVFGTDLINLDLVDTVKDNPNKFSYGDLGTADLELEVPSTGARIPIQQIHDPKARDKRGGVLFVDDIVTPNRLVSFRTAEQDAKMKAIFSLANAGYTVFDIDPFLTASNKGLNGEYARHKGSFPDTFLPSDAGWRVQDIIAALEYIRREKGSVTLVGHGKAGIWALFAHALHPIADKVVVDMDGLDPGNDADWLEKSYAPCIQAVGGLYTPLWLVPSGTTTIMNLGAPLDDSQLPGNAVEIVPGRLGADHIVQRLN